jgi:hypothetical protein
VIVENLNKKINAGLADPKMKARLADLGGTPLRSSPTKPIAGMRQADALVGGLRIAVATRVPPEPARAVGISAMGRYC